MGLACLSPHSSTTISTTSLPDVSSSDTPPRRRAGRRGGPDPKTDRAFDTERPLFEPTSLVETAATPPQDGPFDSATNAGPFKDEHDTWATRGRGAVWPAMWPTAPERPRGPRAGGRAPPRRDSRRRSCYSACVPRAYLTVTIDTECDKGPGWRVARPVAFKGVTDGVAKRLEPLFASLGAKGTYLVSGEVLDDPAAAEVLQRARGDLGTHLHGETVEPGAYTPDITSHFQRDYPEPLERAKLTTLTAQFERTFGRAPVAFRAGRFGVGRHTLRILADLGYAVESSVTPRVDWTSSGAPGLAFPDAPTQPYHPAWEEPGRRGDCPLWEVPITIRKRWANALPVLGPLVEPRWLRPTHMTGRALVRLAEDELREAFAAPGPKAPPVLTCMFHNVEIVPGTSPYAATEGAARRILGAVAELLAFARREDIRVVGLSDLPEVLAL